jgi:hypothetical protein
MRNTDQCDPSNTSATGEPQRALRQEQPGRGLMTHTRRRRYNAVTSLLGLMFASCVNEAPSSDGWIVGIENGNAGGTVLGAGSSLRIESDAVVLKSGTVTRRLPILSRGEADGSSWFEIDLGQSIRRIVMRAGPDGTRLEGLSKDEDSIVFLKETSR